MFCRRRLKCAAVKEVSQQVIQVPSGAISVVFFLFFLILWIYLSSLIFEDDSEPSSLYLNDIGFSKNYGLCSLKIFN